MGNRFNLVDEPWIPVGGVGLVSLRQVFSDPTLKAIGGNPMQKIALTKLLLAIAQASGTPEDDAQWRALGEQGLARQCIGYLETWHSKFFLFGDEPFLQMPAIARAELSDFGEVLPDVATGNTTVLLQSQVERSLSEANKALLLVSLMACALGGKKTDNSVVLSPGYTAKTNDKGKPSTSKPGPAVAHMGLLHSFLQGASIRQTVWLNLLTQAQLDASARFSEGMGKPPWEQMPAGEDCETARLLKSSLMGRLVPMSRFCLLTEHGLHYSEGIAHPNYKEGICDPSVAVHFAKKEPKALWTYPDKRPWRELTALLGFIAQQDAQGFDCLQLKASVQRAIGAVDAFAIWSGGFSVSSNAGEQYFSGSDDFVESVVWLSSAAIGQVWFSQLQLEMRELDDLSKKLYGRVLGYYKKLGMGDAGELSAQATQFFWELCERDFQALVDHCDQTDECQHVRQTLRLRFANRVHQAYDHLCPKETARQLEAWAKNRPNLNTYLQQEA